MRARATPTSARAEPCLSFKRVAPPTSRSRVGPCSTGRNKRLGATRSIGGQERQSARGGVLVASAHATEMIHLQRHGRSNLENKMTIIQNRVQYGADLFF
ncbi:hypothetical protein chiPu_0005053 [Chiloscyllium punctatum]|uniref:Uncharacterized protein n=1 Tax=Chiloscyllium punctatum TaxID=137246 RepID=A0A401S8B2_CHIPU|nr:hypothetical protein [Chiloscyllium punctatum]